MDLWSVHAKNNGCLLPNSFLDKRSSFNTRSMALDTRVSRTESVSSYYRCGSVTVKAMAKKNPGSNSNSSSSNSGNGEHFKGEGDGLKGNSPSGSNEGKNSSSQKSYRKPLDWREFRASLYMQEQAVNTEFISDQDIVSSGSTSLPLKWAHPISAPENGCLLIATEKLDEDRCFGRTVVLLLRSVTRSPYGIIINRPLHKKMEHMNPTYPELATTMSNCSLHFGGPLDASVFLLIAVDNSKLIGFEEVIPGVYLWRKSLDEAAALVKKGILKPQDLRFFTGYSGWDVDQLTKEIESDYWYVAACSANLISSISKKTSESTDLWEEILQLMGGHYSELSRKPKQDS